MYKVAFVCIHNSARSQMAEAFAKLYGKGIIESFSAGTEKYPQVRPLVIEVMNEKSISLEGYYPKLLSDIPKDIDILITMGCGVECPYLPVKHREDWELDDPANKNIDDFRVTRNIIEAKVKDLIKRIKNKEI